MKLFNVKNIGGSLLGLALLGGSVLTSGTTAQAQYWPGQNQTRQQREYERQQQLERQRQLERERQAQQRNGTYNNGTYNNNQRGNRGRRGRLGDGYNNYGGSYELRQTALNAGYNEGMKAGRNDRRSGRYDPQRSSAYRNGTKDYNSRYGDRSAYQRYFRDAFENGYSDGYYGY
jgi:hypothetical protein